MEILSTTNNMDFRTNTQILHSEVAILRKELLRLKAWPEAGDALLELMPMSRWDSLPVTDSDYEWLPNVVRDTLKGLDIGAQYPAFFQKLLTNNELRQSFLRDLSSTSHHPLQ
ncbi:MAG: hypothetical protein GY943_04960 [Chloroflexi bacterium]|nr:hypothetical protein [Chloroflexota bacterium]